MKIELLPGGQMPKRMTAGAVGFDVFARDVAISARIDPHGNTKRAARISLGFKIDASDVVPAMVTGNWAAFLLADVAMAPLLLPRSGWGTKYGFTLRNTVGVIDIDYRGEVIMVADYETCPPELVEFSQSQCNGCEEKLCSNCEFQRAGFKEEQPRVGQMLIVPCYVGKLEQVTKLDDTERGSGGFGSTGV